VLRDILHWLSEYSFELHFLYSSVSEVLVWHVSSTSAYRRRISLAEPVSVLLNVEIRWPTPRTSMELGKRSVSVAAAVIWNSFTVRWKKHVFEQAYTTSENLVFKSYRTDLN